MNSGIYRLVIPRPDQPPYVYFGQSANLSKRKQQHLAELRDGRHSNARTQLAYSKYREANFEVICYAPVKQLNRLEQAFLDLHCGDPVCMNLATHADAPARGRKVSQETRRKISRSVSRAMMGRRHTPETRAKMSAAQKGKVVSQRTRAKMSAAAKARCARQKNA
jgi:group I intron endonuclease